MKLNNNLFILFSFCLLTLLSGCYFDFDDDDDGLFGATIRGSGNVVAEDRLLSPFEQINVEGAISVIITQGNEQLIQIEADDNIIPIIETEVRSRELRIDNSRKYRSDNPVRIYITAPEISKIKMSGSGSVYSENTLEGNLLHLQTYGSGNVDLALDYETLETEGRGSGNFLLSGVVTRQDVKISGSGNYQAKDLTSDVCNIEISGSGNGEVRAESALYIEIRGSGDVTYYGNPETVNTSIKGSGSVIRR